MAILERRERRQIIDLTGPDGNAFSLLGVASNMCPILGLDVDAVLDDMRSGDYEHLITRFDHYFGDFIDLEK